MSSAAAMGGQGAGVLVAAVLVQYAPYLTRLIYLLLLVATVALAVATLRGVAETVPSRRRPRFSVRLEIATDVRPAFFAAVPCLVATWPLSSLYLSLGAVSGSLFRRVGERVSGVGIDAGNRAARQDDLWLLTGGGADRRASTAIPNRLLPAYFA